MFFLSYIPIFEIDLFRFVIIVVLYLPLQYLGFRLVPLVGVLEFPLVVHDVQYYLQGERLCSSSFPLHIYTLVL